MGRAVVTKGHSRRRLGRVIRQLESSVELSSKECSARTAEQKYKEKIRREHSSEDSPIENLRDIAQRKKDPTSK